MVYRLHAYVDRDNGAKHLYEILLPYLNCRPLASNVRPSETKSDDLTLDTEDDVATGAPLMGEGGAAASGAMGSMVDAFGSLGADDDDDDSAGQMMGYGESSVKSTGLPGLGGLGGSSSWGKGNGGGGGGDSCPT